MTRFVVAEVRCICGKWMNIRSKQTYTGETTKKRCWNCSAIIEFRGNYGYVAGQKRPTRIISDETRKD